MAYDIWLSVLQVLLDKTLADRGKSRYWLARETGISEGNLRRIAKHETTSIEYDTLNRICRALKCQPGDLLAYLEDTEEEVEPSG